MSQCRACGGELAYMMANLGVTPLANSYLQEDRLDKESAYPLEVKVCGECYLAQVTTAVDPKIIFSQYDYLSSYSSSWLQHAKQYSLAAVESLGLGKDSLVVEIASNDGYLLGNFVERDIPVVGIEPASNIAELANSKGIRTECIFFGETSAKQLLNKYGKADLMVANNVLAHVPDICDLIAGMSLMLSDDGLLNIEFPHLLSLLQHNQFDTIYHEHYSYLSLTTVDTLFHRFGLRVHHVEALSTHGGSLRVHASKIKRDRVVSNAVLETKEAERTYGLMDANAYVHFHHTIKKIQSQLVQFIVEAKRSGHSLAAYGAAAKGNTLLNYCGLSKDDIDFVVDLNPLKQGKFLPGSHIPILPPEALAEHKPAFILILPWNLKQEITEQLAYCRDWGAKFLVAVPELTLL
ncbi:class I SAM-dependent methyltransferase [Bowmanella denitrificans]|uniref:Class I SAM-dependent methyltransferase n=1 Tax=Bowmanella denitrificans TaxID=366582 RepID=A0ABP3HBP2_9ALTE